VEDTAMTPHQTDRPRQIHVTTNEIARRFGVCAESIRRWARAGRIPSFRAGGRYRFDIEAVEHALRQIAIEAH